MSPIHIFTNEIKEGQVFIAHRDSVEGRTRITLVPDNDYFARQDNPEAFEEQDDSFVNMDGDERTSEEDEMRSEATSEMDE